MSAGSSSYLWPFAAALARSPWRAAGGEAGRKEGWRGGEERQGREEGWREGRQGKEEGNIEEKD